MMYCVTESALNAQLKLIYLENNIIDRHVDIRLNKEFPDKPPRLDAQLAAPYLKLTPGTVGDGRAHLFLPFASGDLYFWEVDGSGQTEAKKLSVEGAGLCLEVPLRMLEIDLSTRERISPDLRSLAEKLIEENPFSLQGLFAVLSEADLIVKSSTIPGPIEDDAQAMIALRQVLESYLELYSGANNPFLMGVSAVASASGDGAADSADRAMPTYVFFTEFAPDPSVPATLNYCLLTQGHEFQPGSGALASPVVKNPDIQGRFVLSNDSIVTPVADQLAAALDEPGLQSRFARDEHGKWAVSGISHKDGHLAISISMNPENNDLKIDYNYRGEKDKTISVGFDDVGIVTKIDAHRTDVFSFRISEVEQPGIGQNVPMLTVIPVLGEFTSSTKYDVKPDIMPGIVEDMIKTLLEALEGVVNGLGNLLHLGNINIIPHMGATFPDGRTVTSQVPVLMPTGKELFFRDVAIIEGGHLSLETSYQNAGGEK